MKIDEVIQALTQCCAQDVHVYGPLPSHIHRVTADSREVDPGSCFVAVRGLNVDAHSFIPQALDRGARLVVGEREPQETWYARAGYIRVPNSRAALAYLSAALYGYPSRRLLVVGVTGTDGKTTTSILIAHVLRAAGYPTGWVTTTGAYIGDRTVDTGFHVTTPTAPALQRYLHDMVRQGVRAVVLESTSHGLHQRRVDAVDFDVAVVTNVTHEHLDYHGTWENYLAAKARLFTLMANAPRKPGIPKVAVLNRDDRSFPYLQALPNPHVVTYGFSPHADVRPLEIRTGVEHTFLRVHTPVGEVELISHLVGDFNVYNVMAAVAVGVGLRLPPERIREGIASVRGIEGRLERIDEGQDFLAVVDFAHSPVALERALRTLRALTSGRVIAVFGSAGLRDVAKRYLMGKIGAELADLVVLTAEDPRTESLEAILEEMSRGARDGGGIEGRTFWRIPDRQEAILHAVHLAEPGDIVAVFGKGHERSMCFGTVEYPWSDQEAVRWALRVRLHGRAKAGPPPFHLPV